MQLALSSSGMAIAIESEPTVVWAVRPCAVGLDQLAWFDAAAVQKVYQFLSNIKSGQICEIGDPTRSDPEIQIAIRSKICERHMAVFGRYYNHLDRYRGPGAYCGRSWSLRMVSSTGFAGCPTPRKYVLDVLATDTVECPWLESA